LTFEAQEIITWPQTTMVIFGQSPHYKFVSITLVIFGQSPHYKFVGIRSVDETWLHIMWWFQIN